MCTVTVLTLANQRVRIACNRDEQRTRGRACPPAAATFGPRRALLPRDPDGGGTWIAANDAGLAMALLNATSAVPGMSERDATSSRGAIIPQLLESNSLETAIRRAAAIDPRGYRPFRLLLVDDTRAAVLGPSVHGIQVTSESAICHPIMLTSSGLGDHLVDGPRRDLFDQMFSAPIDGANAPSIQDAFHRHRWHDRPHLSVDMERDDAETVSVTVIDMDRAHITMQYIDGHPTTGAPESTMTIPRLESVVT